MDKQILKRGLSVAENLFNKRMAKISAHPIIYRLYVKLDCEMFNITGNLNSINPPDGYSLLFFPDIDSFGLFNKPMHELQPYIAKTSIDFGLNIIPSIRYLRDDDNVMNQRIEPRFGFACFSRRTECLIGYCCASINESTDDEKFRSIIIYMEQINDVSYDRTGNLINLINASNPPQVMFIVNVPFDNKVQITSTYDRKNLILLPRTEILHVIATTKCDYLAERLRVKTKRAQFNGWCEMTKEELSFFIESICADLYKIGIYDAIHLPV